MNVQLLGTGAADGIPAFFGNDPVSEYARRHGGKDVRTRSAAIIDRTLKIDFGPDTFHQIQRFGHNPRDWSALIFTHSHEDHLCVSELQYALFPFVEMDHMPWPIYANDAVCDIIASRYPDWPIELVRIRSFQPFESGAYKITPIEANHKEDEDSLNLIFERGGAKFLYATDTGMYPERTFGFLEGCELDGMVLEATDGFHNTPYAGHLDIADAAKLVERLRATNALKPSAQVVTTHHAAQGGATHAQLEAALAPHGMRPGFDGLSIEIQCPNPSPLRASDRQHA